MKKRVTVFLLAFVAIVGMTVSFRAPAYADDGYISCMDHAITHKYALIDAGWSYSAAHAHYLEHTRACYDFFYGGGPYMEMSTQ